MPGGLLRERTDAEERRQTWFAPRGMAPVDEERERVERDVLDQGKREREPARVGVEPPAELVEAESEEGAVRGVRDEPGNAPTGAARDELAEHRDVGVIPAEESAIERLEERPHGRGRGPGASRPCALGHGANPTGRSFAASLGRVPEGDAVHRAARKLQALVGERVEVEAPHPRAAVKGLAARLDGRRLERVEAVGKNLFLHFEGGPVLRSHLRMKGRWSVRRAGERRFGTPWLVLRGSAVEALQWNGPVLELESDVGRRLGPDILAAEPDFDAMLSRLRLAPASATLGEALLDQRLVAGIGNKWMAEALWEARVSPWRAVGDVEDDGLRRALQAAARLMRDSLAGVRGSLGVYRRAGRPCPRCGEAVRSRGQGDANRTAYWCPRCQPERGEPAPSA